MQESIQAIIDHALQLSPAERSRIVAALQSSLRADDIEHGPQESADEVEAAWDAEIARRVEDIASGRIKTIPSSEAWKMIHGEKPVSS